MFCLCIAIGVCAGAFPLLAFLLTILLDLGERILGHEYVRSTLLPLEFLVVFGADTLLEAQRATVRVA